MIELPPESQSIIDAVKNAKSHEEVMELRKRLQTVTAQYTESERMRAFRRFNREVPDDVVRPNLDDSAE